MSSNNLQFGEYIEFTIKKRFGIIMLNRLHRSNAFDIKQFENLKRAVKHCQREEKIRGLILTNNGTSFSTGVDLGAIDGSDHKAVKYLEGTAASICKLLYNGKPAICAINGRTMGEGVVFSTCCDYRIATEVSFFQMPEIFSGIFTGTGCIVLFSRILGIPYTKLMCMFAERIYTQKALKIGLIDQIVKNKEDLMKTALDKAKFLFTKNQTVLNAIKLCANHLFDKGYHQAYEIEKEASMWFKSSDKIQFLKNFRTKFELEKLEVN
ncbi:MAG: enoyl-CoA hydratase/isomerase family protein [Promethearchaeota archaeon]|nr:MAG: enoyl-CoA hydratase/isomerase family protein [Candidatus Lokiarchaeota archaeon]